MKHFHVYDVCGESICQDATRYLVRDGLLRFFDGPLDYEHIAMYNWSNVVCVREEEDDDEGESETTLPSWVPDVVLN
jgi:hypothetical protein